MEIVHHHLFTATSRLDGRSVYLEELDGVDGPVVLLWQLRAELGGPFDPSELTRESMAVGAVPRGAGGAPWRRTPASRGILAVVGRKRGSLVLCPSLLPGFPLALESNPDVLVAPPLVKTEAEVPGFGHGQGDGASPGGPSARADIAR